MADIILSERPFRWLVEPVTWTSSAPNDITIRADGASRWFVDPLGTSPPAVHAPALVNRPIGDFQLHARARLDGDVAFDAAVLVVYVNDHHWAKLCLERSPELVPMVVSVVTRQTSDDCNSFALEKDAVEILLRVSRLDRALAFHASRDGLRWELVRYFTMDGAEHAEVGFLAQSPNGRGATATFSEIAFTGTRLSELRNGV